jgi:hypothetical protein
VTPAPRPLAELVGGVLHLDAMVLVGLIDADSPWHSGGRAAPSCY